MKFRTTLLWVAVGIMAIGAVTVIGHVALERSRQLEREKALQEDRLRFEQLEKEHADRPEAATPPGDYWTPRELEKIRGEPKPDRHRSRPRGLRSKDAHDPLSDL